MPTVYPSSLRGRIVLPPSDLEVCCFLAAAAFSDSPCVVCVPGLGADSQQMVSVLTTLGASFQISSEKISVTPISASLPETLALNFGSSALCFEILLPVVCSRRSGVRFIASLRETELLRERPLLNLLREHGCAFDSDTFPFYADGIPDSGAYRILESLSEPALFGISLMLSLFPDRGQILFSPSPEQRRVLNIFSFFNAAPEETLRGFFFPAGRLTPSAPLLYPRGDPGYACLWLSAGALSGPITVSGVDSEESPLPELLTILKESGACVRISGSEITVSGSAECAPFIRVPSALLPSVAVLLQNAPDGIELESSSGAVSDFAASVAALDHAYSPFGQRFSMASGVCSCRGSFCGGAAAVSPFGEVLASLMLSACRAEASVSFPDLSPLAELWPEFCSDFRRLGGRLEDSVPESCC